jgi:hypothetical protein
MTLFKIWQFVAHSKIPSDFTEVVWEPMDAGGGWKQSLARELEASGHDID